MPYSEADREKARQYRLAIAEAIRERRSNTITLAGLAKRVANLETVVADHERRIAALEAGQTEEAS